MALSGGSYDSFARHRFGIEWSASQSVSGNYSDVKVNVYLQSIDSYGAMNAPATNSGSVTINGTVHSFTNNSNLAANQKKVLYSVTQRVGHNSDGTKSFNISATYNVNVTFSGVYYGNRSTSGTYALNSIPRAYTFQQNRTDYDFDSPITVFVNSNGSGYKANVRLYFGTKSVTLRSDCPIGSNFTVTPSGADFATQISNNASGTGSLIVDTYNGTTKIGETAHTGITFRLPNTSAYSPSISNVTVTEQNTTVQNILGTMTDTFVQSKSIIRAGSTVSTAFGSAIQSYKYEIGSLSLTSTTGTQDFDLSKNNIANGSKEIKLTVTDTRGRSATFTKTFTLLGYSAPSLSNFSVSRVDNTTTLILTKTASVSSLKNGTTEKNTYTLVTKYKKSVDTAWVTAKTETNTSSNFNLTGFSVDSSYDITVTLADKFTSITVQGTISTARVPLDLHKDIGVGIGKLHEEGHGVLDVGGGIWAEEIVINGLKLIDIFYPTGTIYESTNSANPTTIMGGTWERFGNGRVLVGVDETDTVLNESNVEGGSINPLTQHNHGAPSWDGKQSFYWAWGSASTRTNTVRDANSSATAGAYSGGNPIHTIQGSEGRYSTNTGDNTNHNNWQPYVTVYRWRRIA